MTITIHLPDRLAAHLAALPEGERHAFAVSAIEDAVLAAAPPVDEDDLDTALEEAFAQMEAGEGRPFEEYAAEFSTRFAARHGLPQT